MATFYHLIRRIGQSWDDPAGLTATLSGITLGDGYMTFTGKRPGSSRTLRTWNVPGAGTSFAPPGSPLAARKDAHADFLVARLARHFAPPPARRPLAPAPPDAVSVRQLLNRRPAVLAF